MAEPGAHVLSGKLRSRIVASARTWIGTPYVHQASRKGAGTDCLGLVRGVWREVMGSEPERPPPYTPDWAEASGRETLLEAARRWLLEVEPRQAGPGDVLAFRWRPDLPAKHLAIAAEPDRIIHAFQGHAVQEVELPRAWERRVAAVFSFPGAT